MILYHPYDLLHRLCLAFIFLLLLNVNGYTQFGTTEDSVTERAIISRNETNFRPLVTGGATVVFFTGSLIALNDAWYKDYNRTPFHTFNDSREWLQVDKAGHMWSVYTMSKLAGNLWQWSGLNKKNAVLAGSASSLAYLTAIEYMDGRSAKWGWSWADMAANLAGTGMYAAQEFAWNEQRLLLKFSAHQKKYDATLRERADALFGDDLAARILKDYNQQTYWFSGNIQSFIPQANIPGWLNIAIGYGAEGMLGGFENAWTDKNGNYQTRYDVARTRQFYLSPDIDFTRIKTQNKSLKVLFQVLNSIKFPAPALMINSKGKLKAYAIYF